MLKKISTYKWVPVLTMTALLFSGCEKDLEQKVFDRFSETTFFKTPADAAAATTTIYKGLLGGVAGSGAWGGYGSSADAWTVQSDVMGGIYRVDWDGFNPSTFWGQYGFLNWLPDRWELNRHYLDLAPMVTGATLYIDNISKMNISTDLKDQYVGQIKALRGHYAWLLLNFYGGIALRYDPAEAADPNAKPKSRASVAEMVSFIEKDYKDAAAILPETYPATAYGRITKGACLMGLLKLYMHQKRWDDAIAVGKQIKALGDKGVYKLQTNYRDIFAYENQGNSEIILGIPAKAGGDLWPNTNIWLAHALPASPAYVPPSGRNVTQWGGYKVPWHIYDKFDENDKRLSVLLRKYPVVADGSVTFDCKTGAFSDGRAAWSPKNGAIPMKYGIDPNAAGENQGVNIVVWRYADALLLLAEALNEKNGPTTEVYELIGMVRTRAGLSNISSGLSKSEVLKKIKDERLFELWCEGQRREDLIRWGDFLKVQFTYTNYTPPKDDHVLLYPLPRKVINESNGVIKQNPGYQ